MAPLFHLVAPPMLDVQTGGRLVRLEHRQGEYWLLSLMLAGLKTQGSLYGGPRPQPTSKYLRGFFADPLNDVLASLPEHLWKAARRKRTYVNQVLARAEVHSAYQPSRQLWARTLNGHYVPNPLMQLRGRQGAPATWRPVYEVLNLAWIEAGTASPASRDAVSGLTDAVEIAARRAGGAKTHGPGSAASSDEDQECD